MEYMIACGRHGGSSNNLNKAQAAEIKWLALYTRTPQADIAKLYGVSINTVGRIKTGVTWANVELDLDIPPDDQDYDT
jgi:hypothetical protein